MSLFASIGMWLYVNDKSVGKPRQVFYFPSWTRMRPMPVNARPVDLFLSFAFLVPVHFSEGTKRIDSTLCF